MSVDYRTRRDEDVEDIDFVTFFTSVLPHLLDKHAACVTPWLQQNTPNDLSIICGEASWQLRGVKRRILAAPGISSEGLLVRLSTDEFSGLINDLYTPMTFFVSGDLDIVRGDMSTFLDWWLIIRALVDGRTVHIPGGIDFHGSDGKALDLTHSFHMDDPVEDMRHFLQTAGFLHIRGVFTEGEMAAVSNDIDAHQDKYYEGDDKSWWATTREGARRPVRLQRFDHYSAATRTLLSDPRFLMIGDISGNGHVHAGLQDNAIEALIKPLNVVEGISDLPWHKDCSLGRHSYECCSLTVGISVTGAEADSGQLRVIAGSHRVLMWPALLSNAEQHGLPVIDLPTGTGDITAHLSCTHHMSQAPRVRERRVMYTGFRLPSVAVDNRVASKSRISRAREAAYKNVSQ
ncbi:MAG: phytanoyl-CoA dioxygenase family protein [Halioglobus sp.]|nr:phytanoyl-CoA dioxygenase family protein [Halioglobus sp.]